MTLVKKITGLTLSSAFPVIRLDPSLNSGTLILLDALNPASKPVGTIVSNTVWTDLSSHGRNAVAVMTNGKLSNGTDNIRFADDNLTDFLKIPNLFSDLVARSFMISIMFERTVDPTGNNSAIGSGLGSNSSGSSFGVGFQSSGSSQVTFVRDSANALTFSTTQYSQSQTLNQFLHLGLSVQIFGGNTRFQSLRQTDAYPLITSSDITTTGVTGIYNGGTEINIGANGNGSLPRFRGKVFRVIAEDLTVSGLTPLQFMQREWDNNRSRFTL